MTDAPDHDIEREIHGFKSESPAFYARFVDEVIRSAKANKAAGGLQRHAHGETGFVLPPIERESEPQEVGSKINDLPEGVARLPWHLRATAFEEMLDGCSTHGHLDISRGAVPPLFARLNTASHFGRNA